MDNEPPTPIVPGFPRRSFWQRTWPAWTIAVLAIVLVASGALEHLRLDGLQREFNALLRWVEPRPHLAALLLVAALALLVASGLPGGVVIVIAIGALFGPIAGALLSALGDTLGGSVLYFATRRLFLGGDGTPPRWVGRLRGAFDRSPLAYSLFLRLAPLFPFGVASAALAWLGCRPLMFVVTSAVGILPGTWIFASLGSSLANLLATGQPIDASVLRQPGIWAPLTVLGLLALIPALLSARRKPPPPGAL